MAAIRNVLIITTDHHRFDAFGFMGNALAFTPNLDRLASQSVRFAQCYTQSPVCQPARLSIASGRYVNSHGVVFNEGVPPVPDYRTIGHAVAPRGYRRINVGHMHWTNTEGDRQPDYDTGFERWITRQDWRETQSPDVLERFDWEIQRVSRLTTGGPSTRTAEEYWGHHVATETVREITRAAADGDPFLAVASIWEPHPPFYPPADIYRSIDQSAIAVPQSPEPRGAPRHPSVEAKSRKWDHLSAIELRQMIAGYYGLVALADRYVGMILDAVESLGIADETLIVFTSDHGEQLWDHDLFLKFVFYEESVHVPLWFSHPSFSPGERWGLVEHVDVAPTICRLVGVDPPAGAQGRSLTNALAGGEVPDREAVFSEIGKNAMIRTERYKLNLYDGKPGELYDMVDDPGEHHNRINEPAARSIVARLEGLYRAGIASEP